MGLSAVTQSDSEICPCQLYVDWRETIPRTFCVHVLFKTNHSCMLTLSVLRYLIIYWMKWMKGKWLMKLRERLQRLAAPQAAEGGCSSGEAVWDTPALWPAVCHWSGAHHGGDHECLLPRLPQLLQLPVRSDIIVLCTRCHSSVYQTSLFSVPDAIVLCTRHCSMYQMP